MFAPSFLRKNRFSRKKHEQPFVQTTAADLNGIASDLKELNDIKDISSSIGINGPAKDYQVNILDNPVPGLEVMPRMNNKTPGGAMFNTLEGMVKKEQRKRTIKDMILSFLGVR